MASSRKSNSSDRVGSAIALTLDRFPEPCGRLAVAYSGGLDSSVLLHASATEAKRRGWTIDAIHCHHGISSNADYWARHCQATCDRLQVPCLIEHLAVDKGSGIEERARRARYAVFDQVAADLILLGHHAGDQAETVLFNLCRGAGALGLAGIPACRSKYRRPLIAIERDELVRYASEHGLTWCEDESNTDHRYTRNYIRHAILPLIRARFPSVDKSISNYAGHAATARVLLRDLAEIDAAGSSLEFPFPLAPFRSLSIRRSENLLHVLISGAGVQAPPLRRLEEFARQLASFAPDRHPELRLGAYSLRYKSGFLHLNQL